MIRLDSFGIFIQTDLTCYNKTNFPLIRQVEFRTKMKLSHQLNECKLKSLKKMLYGRVVPLQVTIQLPLGIFELTV